MQSDTVLSEEQVVRLCLVCHASTQVSPCEHHLVRAIERATIEALAARSVVDIDTAAWHCEHALYTDDGDPRATTYQERLKSIALTIRLTLAALEALHAQRETWWRELASIYHRVDHDTAEYDDAERGRELRTLLGLDPREEKP
jgi:hypothetical protein